MVPRIATGMVLAGLLLAAPAPTGEPASTEKIEQRMRYLRELGSRDGEPIPYAVAEAAWKHRQGMRSADEKDGLGIAQQTIPGDLWIPLGPATMVNPGGVRFSGRIRSIAISPANTSIVYVGSATGGIWRTDNGGGHWFPVADDQRSLTIGSVVIDPQAASIVYAGTGEYGGGAAANTGGAGVLRSFHAGQSWDRLGGENWRFGGQRIARVALDPTTVPDPQKQRVVWVAATSGLWRSPDSGGSWDRVLEGNFSDVILDPTVPNVAYAAKNGAGIFKYVHGQPAPTDPLVDDNGNLPTQDFGRINLAITHDTATQQVVLVATMEDQWETNQLKGVWKTVDGGTSWTRLSGAPREFSNGSFTVADDVESEAPNASGGNDGIGSADPIVMGSVVQGRVHTGGDVDVFALPVMTDPSLSVEICADRANTGLLPTVSLLDASGAAVSASVRGLRKSGTDAHNDLRIEGSSWSSVPRYIRVAGKNGTSGDYQLSLSGPELGCQCNYDQVVALEPGNAQTIYVGSVSLFRSTTGGTDWEQIQNHGGTNTVHTDQHTITFVPGNPQSFYLGNDGGIWRTPDRGDTWINLNADLSITQHFQGVSQSRTDPGFLLVGCQDNGSTRLQNGQWTQVAGADGGFTAIQDTNTWYVSEQNLRIRKTTDNRATSPVRIVTDNMQKGADFIAPFRMDPDDDQILIAGGGNTVDIGGGMTRRDHVVYRTINGGEDWMVNSQALGHRISALAIAPSDTDTYYAATITGRIWRTTDKGATDWTELTRPNLPAQRVNYLAVDPLNPDVVYATFAGYGTGHVFRSPDGGTTWVDISALSGDPATSLANAPIYTIAIDPNFPDTLFVGDDLGILRTVNAGGEWTRFERGLPRVRVFDLVIEPATGKFRAATFGRGVWELVPGNDPCDNATVISDGTFSGTTRSAEPEGSTTCAPTADSPDVWYSYTATCDGILNVDTCGTGFDTVVSHHFPVCPGTEVNEFGCSDDCSGTPCGGTTSCLKESVFKNLTYLVRVSGYNGASGDFEMHVSCDVPGDDCAAPVPIQPGSMASGSTRGAGLDYAPVCQGVADDTAGVWYTVVGTGNTMTASLCSGSTIDDSKLSVYCSGCVQPTCIAANDNACGSDAEVSWCAAPGAIYNVLVHGDGEGTYDLSLTDGPYCGPFYLACDPANNECANAQPLGLVGITGDNGGSSTEATATCATSGNDVWYAYESGCNGFTTLDTCDGSGTLADTVLSVWDECLGQELACNDDATSCAPLRSRVTLPHEADTSLRVRVADYGGNGDTGSFRVDADLNIAPLSLPWPALYVSDGNGSLEDWLLRLDPDDGAPTALGPLGLTGVAGMAYAPGLGLLYAVDDSIDTDNMATVDPQTGAAAAFGPVGYSAVRGLAYDSVTLRLYGADTNSDVLIEIDPFTGAGRQIGLLGFGGVEGLAFDPGSGTLYGSDVATDQLLTIDTTTGAATAVGPLGFGEVRGLAFDSGQGVLYGVDLDTATGNGRLIVIDPSTGAARQVGLDTADLGPDGLAIAPGLPSATVGRPYDAKVPLAGGCPEYHYNNVSGLPPGLSADVSGRITGVPTSVGEYAFSFDVDDSDLSVNPIGGVLPLRVRPANDRCTDAEAIDEGLTAFTNLQATTDGPDEPTACNFFGDTQVGSDVWYCYEADCTGMLTVSTCGVPYDTKLALYDGCGCPAAESAVACNDDFCATQSQLVHPVTAGELYSLRIGGYNGAQGSGDISIVCSGDPGGACCTVASCALTTADQCLEMGGDYQGDATACTPDSDGDGAIDACDDCPLDSFKIVAGDCGCGFPDLDTDGDGLADCLDDDDDGDGFPGDLECDDLDPDTYPGAPEVNDALDNDCPGSPGYGLVDEISGLALFEDPDYTFSWPAQMGATGYEVARSSAPTFPAGCLVIQTATPSWTDPSIPPPATTYYYLVRTLTPFPGSWGADSFGIERMGICP